MADLRELAQLTATVEDGEYLDCVRMHTIDEPIRELDQFTHVSAPELWNNASRLRKLEAWRNRLTMRSTVCSA